VNKAGGLPMIEWMIVEQTGLITLTATARTKSEARAKFKAFFGVKRLPTGVHVKPIPADR